MKRQILLLILLAAMGQKPTASQPTPIDTQYRKVWITGTAGACSFLHSPVAGVLGEIEITDAKYPLIIHFNGGILAVANMAKRGDHSNKYVWPYELKPPNAVMVSQLDFGRRFKKMDVVISPIGFIGAPNWDFAPIMSLALHYRAIQFTKKSNLEFRIQGNYTFALHPAWGVTATLNYKIKQFKKL